MAIGIHGADAKLLVDKYDLSGYFKTIDAGGSAGMHDTTTFGKTARTYIKGLTDGHLGAEGFWDGEVGGIAEALEAALTAQTNRIITGAYNTLAVGKRVWLMAADAIKYAVTSPIDDVTQANAEFQPNGGIDFGVALHDVAAAQTASANGTSVDNAASSANGGVGHLNVTTVSGSGASATIKIQHSSNNSTWVDLITFTAVVTEGSQRVELAAGSTVNRYVRAIATITGTTPSFTYAVAFARR